MSDKTPLFDSRLNIPDKAIEAQLLVVWFRRWVAACMILTAIIVLKQFLVI
jgi:hypothetical protein